MAERDGATIGVDIGGTRIRVGRRDGHGGFTAERTLTPHNGVDGASAIIAMAQTIAPEGVARVGISSAGPLDFARGITNPLNLPGWHGLALVDELTQALDARVFMDNDANCAWPSGARGRGKGQKPLSTTRSAPVWAAA